MTVRVYVPSTLAGLQVLQRDGQLFPLGGTVFGVTPALREAYTSGDEEELAEAAMRHAARASLRLLAVDDDAPGATAEPEEGAAEPDPVRRVVITVDVPEAKERPDLDDAVLKVTEPIQLSNVLSVHVDVSEAEEAVVRAAQVVDAADLGDEDAELAVGDAEDHDLAWYATQELPFLLELL
ncbi:DUF6912 domain-containing protein [Tsukamurella strandjordii]|uniref:DUF6912 family protein n=1 Tax=Tsukamurella TaxID=2060 RepID=UPI001C7CAA18|nr:hypothetical protein [Tsukamurella sp. TY48]GIZ96157.1 hypothetical protein TTY48_07690 [Tsukamurella sp. TY48]